MGSTEQGQTESPALPGITGRDESAGSKEPRIRRGRVDSLSLYEITESELQSLQEGSPASLLLNFAVFCWSTMLSFLVALMTTDIKSDRTFTVFVCISLITGLAAVVLTVLWWKQHRSTRSIVKKIKERLQEGG